MIPTHSVNSAGSRNDLARNSFRDNDNNDDSNNPALVVNIEDILKNSRSIFWRIVQKQRLLHPGDYFYSVDLTALWRRHLVWSHKDSKELLEIVTGRFATTQIFLSLLFAAAVGTYFSPSRIVTDVRSALRTGPFEGSPLEYACGITLILSISLTGCAVLANYTALGIFKSISIDNAAMILRSDVGLYAAQLPSRLTFLSIVIFFAWNVMFWWINNEGYLTPSIVLTVFTALLLTHVISTFSAMSRIIMETGAMGSVRVLPKDTEEQLLPHELTNVLLTETLIARRLHTKVNHKYRLMDSPNSDEPFSYEMSLKMRHPDIQLEQVQEMIAE